MCKIYITMTEYIDPNFIKALCCEPKKRTLQELQIIYYGLHGLEPLSTYRDSVLRALCKLVRYEKHQANEVLFYTGERAQCWYILLSGAVFIGGSMFLPGSSQKKWTHERKLLLLTQRFKLEYEFNGRRRKKSVLWENVLRNIKEVETDFPFNRDEISIQFLNRMVTYKRIKKRNSSSGEAATSWEYFDIIDEVYGTRSCITVPEENLDSSLTSSLDIFGEEENITSTVCSQLTSDNEPRKKRQKNNEILEFLKTESEADKKLIKELIEIEKQKLEVDKTRIEEMRELKDLMRSFLK